MATVSELITGAFRLHNISAVGHPLEPEEAAEGLRVLNQMLADWSLDDEFIRNHQRKVRDIELKENSRRGFADRRTRIIELEKQKDKIEAAISYNERKRQA